MIRVLIIVFAMDLHQIEIFCTLVRLRSFSKAADALFLTQPTVSGHIKNLETELGVKLLDRIGRQVIPTEAGEMLLRTGRHLLELRDRVREEIVGFSGGIGGVLKIGASTIPGAYILPSFIGAFKRKHPAASVHLEIGDTANVTEAVLNGSLHLGVVGARAADTKLESHPFLTDELVIAVPPKHRWASKRAVPVKELAGEPFVLREQGSGTRRVMEERIGKAGIRSSDLNTVVVAGSSDAVRESVKAGLGISILSIRAIREDIKARRIAAVRIKDVTFQRSFYVILLKGKSRSLLGQTFFDFLLEKKVS